MPLRFTLRQLEYFVAVGEAGSIAKAAEQVNVSPPSISASIAQLEAEFGVQLFVRKHSHALALTAGGRLFLKEAARLLDGTGWLPEPLRIATAAPDADEPSAQGEALPEFLTSDDATADASEERPQQAAE